MNRVLGQRHSNKHVLSGLQIESRGDDYFSEINCSGQRCRLHSVIHPVVAGGGSDAQEVGIRRLIRFG